MRRYRSADETREILRSFDVLDEAAFDLALYRGDWKEDPTVPAPSVVPGAEVYGWDELELVEWMTEHGVGPRAHLIVSGPTGFAKTSIMKTFEAEGYVLVDKRTGGGLRRVMCNCSDQQIGQMT